MTTTYVAKVIVLVILIATIGAVVLPGLDPRL